MARPFIGIRLDGAKGLIKDLKKVQKEVKRNIEAEIEDTAKMIVAAAQADVPSKTGALRNSIKWRKIGELRYEIVAEEHYAPYVEFGTGKLVVVPKGLEDYAIQFKGLGIKEVNLHAHPYLFPAYERHRVELVRRIKALLEIERYISVTRPGPSNITGVTTI
ncbi:HK97-gp10 family putative phage morphogenesis protein [Chitinophaga pinensis]|uniref:Phage protein, HK97 gp10 family n=1 Tax=Chitinophaga pinensis (strain ATCC 43595 / DSM 2588 / LMG 13176 / NBRC 15968 / NCIMB 11800 / UQM 2034) TaxID=485918 RepID=A0A979G629_CHIPD|nr:HK97-gp10 family putative phage morphogenesis protein [Chitinophaga pinensis]ACU61358.1 phage protein, HK97 gp10 family [Chitinophaga pinensis DSM 2588]